MHTTHRIIAVVLLAAIAGATQAKAPKDPLTDCVDLGAGHEASRFGSQYLLVADGESHYRLSFGGGSCDALAYSTQVEISTGRQANQLCPKGTRVTAKTHSCSVQRVERISADDYARYQRKGR